MSIEAQLQVKHNAEIMRTFFKDVTNWEDEMKQMDEQLRNLPETEDGDEQYEENEDNESEETGEDDENIINKEKVANEYKEKGNELVKFGKWKEAIEFYDKAIELNENEAVYYGNRSYCYLQLNELEQAELDCTHALDINSKYDKVLLRRAMIRIKRDLIKDAAIDLDNLLQIDPKNTIALKELKCIYPKLKALNYNIEIKTRINEINDDNEEIKAVSKDSTLEEECKEKEMKSTKYKADNPELVKTNATNEVKTKSEDDDDDDNLVLLKKKSNLRENNESYIEVKPYKSIPAHHRSKVPLRRITIEDIFV